MKLVTAFLLVAFTLPAIAQNTPSDPNDGTPRCNHRPTLPGCPYWCKFHKDDARCAKSTR